MYLANTLRTSIFTYYKLPLQWHDHIHQHTWEYDTVAPGLGKHTQRRKHLYCSHAERGRCGLAMWVQLGLTKPEFSSLCWDLNSLSLVKVFSHSFSISSFLEGMFYFLLPWRDTRIDWLISVKHQRKKQCVNATVDYRYSAFQRSMSSLWAQLDLWDKTENCILRAWELLLDSLCKYSMPVYAVCPELHLPYSQFFLLYLAIYYYALVLL